MVSSTSRSTQRPEKPAVDEDRERALRVARRRAGAEQRRLRRADIGLDDRPDWAGTDPR